MLGIRIVIDRGGSIINYNDDLHYPELSNKDIIDSLEFNTTQVLFKDPRRSFSINHFSNFQPRNNSGVSDIVPPPGSLTRL